MVDDLDDYDARQRDLEADVQASANTMNDLNRFDQKLKSATNPFGKDDSSSDEEDGGSRPPRRPQTQVEILTQKNQILMEKLFKSEKQVQDLKDTYEAVTTSYDNIKDKKIIELAKQKRQLQMQVESLRTRQPKPLNKHSISRECLMLAVELVPK